MSETPYNEFLPLGPKGEKRTPVSFIPFTTKDMDDIRARLKEHAARSNFISCLNVVWPNAWALIDSEPETWPNGACACPLCPQT